MGIKKIILGNLNENLEGEKDAKNFYERYLPELKDTTIVEKFKKIRDDEIEHIKLIEDSIKLIKAEPRIVPEVSKKMEKLPDEEAKSQKRLKEALTDFSEGYSILILLEAKNHLDVKTRILKHLINEGFNCIYVTVNRSSDILNTTFEKRGVDIKKIKFINLVEGFSSKDAVTVSPKNLTNIGIEISKANKDLSGKKFVLFDTISTLFIYNPIEAMEKFVHFTTSQASRENFGLVLLTMKDESKGKFFNTVSSFCDKIVEL